MGVLARPLKAMLLSPFVSQQMGMMMADATKRTSRFGRAYPIRKNETGYRPDL